MFFSLCILVDMPMGGYSLPPAPPGYATGHCTILYILIGMKKIYIERILPLKISGALFFQKRTDIQHKWSRPIELETGQNGSRLLQTKDLIISDFSDLDINCSYKRLRLGKKLRFFQKKDKGLRSLVFTFISQEYPRP